MIYSIDFELFSILILTVLIVYNYFIMTKNKTSIHLFQRMILLDLIMCLSESIYIMMQGGFFKNTYVMYGSLLVAMTCYAMIPYQFIAYIIVNIEGKEALVHYGRRLRIPVIALVIMILFYRKKNDKNG